MPRASFSVSTLLRECRNVLETAVSEGLCYAKGDGGRPGASGPGGVRSHEGALVQI